MGSRGLVERGYRRMGNLESLSEKDQFLIKNAALGYEAARGLLAWWKDKESKGALHYFPLVYRGTPALDLNCFYDAMPHNGGETSVMGVTWKTRYERKRSSPPPDPTLDSFIRKSFLQRCQWENPDHLPGGFHFIPHQYKLKGSDGYGAFGEGEELADVGDIGTKYDWLVMESVVHDFFRNTPGPRMPTALLKKMPRMASYVLLHPDYFSSFFPPVPGTAAERCFGYSFLPCFVQKNIFGYGPGMFKAAVKQFRFILLQNGEIEIHMCFFVAPRSEKILSLGKKGRDPVYGAVNVINALTLNLLHFKQWAHDKLDASQLEVHARIYQSLLDGMKGVWENQDWISSIR